MLSFISNRLSQPQRSSRWLLWLLLAACTTPAFAQTPALPERRAGLEKAPLQTTQLSIAAPGDTARVFSLQNLADLVFANHPIVKQAALLSDEARSQVLQARGGFDPKLGADFYRKQFGGTDYYNNWGNELKIPLWPGGIDLKASYDRYVGTYVNPESRTSGQGLAGIGLSVPIGAGLLIDARRSTLRQARVLQGAAEAERVKQINEVWLQAAKDYWNWYYTFRQAALIEEGVALADRRFQGTVRRAQIGDQAPIDSVEAQITVQDRQVQAEQLRVDLQNARLILSNHLWTPAGQPAELPAYAIPQVPSLDSVSRAELARLADFAAAQHPTLRKLEAKISQLGIEERYRREMLKPKLNVSGVLLSQGNFYQSEVPAAYNFGRDNYKVGVDFAFPLFLRAERGKLQYTRIQLKEVALERQQSQRTIVTQVNTVFNTLRAYERQLALQAQTIANQRLLLQAELQKFELGESTIFLINARETKLIDLRIKQESLRASYEKSRAELYYYAGMQSLAAAR
ncbi:TolC family protein [Hymenobacter siberiensis]|jgi:outer membrane protein TolC|uniref:TolC family protein n=1 Tax=Hymenobacter siberiensis TaxID=2848396 RepID=UPI001C1E2BE7|nr:TolC family protein [Hymenobacter siberiensis]MBU6119834.1 TolC family protein [Hymenobacter siberiensis]